MWLYDTHGRFPNGKSLDEQDELFWQQLTIMQRLNARELRVMRGDDSEFYEPDDELTEEPEPEPMTLDMM